MQQNEHSSLLKDQIVRFQRLVMKPRISSTPKVIAASEELASKLAAPPKDPDTFQLDKIDQMFREALEGGHCHRLSAKHWKWAPYLLWFKSPFLAEEQTFIDKYLHWLSDNPLASNWRKLIFVYLRDFRYHKQYATAYGRISQAIRDAFLAEVLGQRLQRWKQRHEAFDLFSGRFHVKRVTSAFVDMPDCNLRDFAEMTGLDGQLSQGGYAEAIGLELLKTVRDRPEKAMDKVQAYHLAEHSALRFPRLRVPLIEFHLAPWLGNPSGQDDNARQRAQTWLLKLFGDPRIPKHRNDGWRGVGDRELQVVYRWLAGETLNRFFSIIDNLALERQWEYRKAFWKAYYDRGLLNDAWVALGPDAWRYAKGLFGGDIAAARLDGAADNQSVLLVSIGDLVFVEWSHQGKCRSWKADDNNAPRLYEPTYDRRWLTTKSIQIVSHHKQDGISHQSSESYWWQNQLSNFIVAETGVRMSERDYRI